MKKIVSFLILISSLIFAIEAYTPPKGSVDRVAIMDALRAEVKHYHKIDIIFKVQYLKVKNGWAWIAALPMSRDGQSNYEDVTALLHNKKGAWIVEELVCTEAETPGCIDDPNFFKDLKKKYPQVPSEIFRK